MITFKDIQKAQELIGNQIIKTPCTYSTTLSEHTNCNVFLKLENLQFTGAYKVRGALNRLMNLTEDEKAKGVIASSAGNHAQGVALAAKKLGIKATIVMPETTPLSKIQGTKKFGANVILHGNFYDEAYQKAQEIQAKKGYIFIHPFNDDDIIAGQGTIGLEVFDALPDLDIVVVPIGGGGLISGISIALKTLNPKIRIVGVEAEQMAAMKASVEAKKIVEVPKAKTIADGIAVTTVKENTFEIVSKYVDEIVTVTEPEMAQSIMMLLEVEKILVEGAGSAAFAALSHGKISNIDGKKVGVIISGGNIDVNFLSRVIERGLSEDGRLTTLKIMVPDTPGIISEISKIVSDHGANIVDIHHNRTFSNTHLGQTAVHITLETKGHKHIKEIISSIKKTGLNVLKN
ncbi:threonine ammonia-lyase [Halobacteriovorax sp. JY17]|uniref:threonine ammonia-lyase n=1 Tax=Halobacteriovorax sp. JY17 TaxID=2014617 RepID=UPI000C56CA9D|nr:threonine ammonia-lyase [Halobacteriovorax sp. JY17]PIK13676.1 MAG: threonine ammonia-lyase [Halobacteriovorax sp. JY17]